MRRALFVALLMASPLAGQQPPADSGPPYQMKVVDLVFNVVDMGGRVEDLAVKETDTEVRIEMAADVLFDFDKASLLPKAEAMLAKAVDLIRQRAGSGMVRIEGYTDAKGTDSYNQKLSARRAEAVRRWFESHGLRKMHLSAQGFGAKHPVAPNAKADGSDDPEGRAKNRRVEIVIAK